MAKLIASCGLVATLLFPLNAFAQSPQSQTYGTQGEIALVVNASAFSTWNSTQTFAGGAVGERWVTNNNGCCLEASVSLPSGASVIGVGVEGCDRSATAPMVGGFAVCNSTTGCVGVVPDVQTAANVGCGQFRTNFTTPVTVNNALNSYAVDFDQNGDTSGNVVLLAMRVYYKLQISPDPATATFADVPVGHPFHRFVEALAASGITGGCGNGNYCPDAPITRGQMAVFLAGALGLHWAP